MTICRISELPLTVLPCPLSSFVECDFPFEGKMQQSHQRTRWDKHCKVNTKCRPEFVPSFLPQARSSHNPPLFPSESIKGHYEKIREWSLWAVPSPVLHFHNSVSNRTQLNKKTSCTTAICHVTFTTLPDMNIYCVRCTCALCSWSWIMASSCLLVSSRDFSLWLVASAFSYIYKTRTC